MPGKKGKAKKSKSKPRAKKAGKSVNVTQKVVIAGGTGGGGGGGGGAGGGGGFQNTYAPPPPYMPTQPTWFSGPGYAMERGERAVYNEHGVAGVAKTPSVPQAHSNMSVGDNIRHHQGTRTPSRMEVDEPSFSVPPTQAFGSASFSVPPTQAFGSGSFSVPPTQVVGGMSTGSTSAPVFSASSVKGPRMSTGTSAAPASGSSFSFSASVRGAGQTVSVPSTQVVPSVGARTPLPDTEVIDESMPSTRVAGARRTRDERSSSSSVGNYNATHDTASSGRVEPNAIVPRALGESGYGTPPNWTVRMPGLRPGKFARVEDRLMRTEAERMRRVLEESIRPRRELTWSGDTEMVV